jgi:hypothetical protein
MYQTYEIMKIKSKYNSISEWKKADSSAFYNAQKDNLLDQICELFGWRKGGLKWYKEACKQDALKYRTIKEWQDKSQSAYNSAYHNDWIEYCCKHMPRFKENWTKEKCQRQSKKYSSIKEWQKKSSGSYQAAKRNNWFDECIKHIPPKIKPTGYWNQKNCLADAKKFKTRYEWQKKSAGAYNSAFRNGWLDMCFSHMCPIINKPSGTWTKENCKKDALQYQGKREWYKNSSGAVSAARINGWYVECTQHMKYDVRNRSKNNTSKYKPIISSNGIIHESIKATAKYYNVSPNAISSMLTGRRINKFELSYYLLDNKS